MPRKPRRSFTAEQKAALLRSHHVDKVPISKLGEVARWVPRVG